MRRAEMMQEWINRYKQALGEKPSEVLIKRVDVIFQTCDRYKKIGENDRNAGKPAMSRGAILARIRPIARFYSAMKHAEDAADLLHDSYLLGYEPSQSEEYESNKLRNRK